MDDVSDLRWQCSRVLSVARAVLSDARRRAVADSSKTVSGTRRPLPRRILAVPTALLLGVVLLAGLLPLPAVGADAPQVRAVALFKDKAVLEINGRQRVVKTGETTGEGITLVHADSSGAVIAFDGVEQSLALDGKISANFSNADSRRIIRLVPGRNGHYFADGQINGHPVRFLVDTGASSVAISRTMAKSIGILYRVDGKPISVNTASGIASAWRVTFNEVKVEALTLRNVQGVVIDQNALGEALLGQSFLNRLDIHRAGAVMELRER